jgi:hypothetical protein
VEGGVIEHVPMRFEIDEHGECWWVREHPTEQRVMRLRAWYSFPRRPLPTFEPPRQWRPEEWFAPCADCGGTELEERAGTDRCTSAYVACVGCGARSARYAFHPEAWVDWFHRQRRSREGRACVAAMTAAAVEPTEQLGLFA